MRTVLFRGVRRKSPGQRVFLEHTLYSQQVIKQVHVANNTARFALTTRQVNLNDVVVVGTAPSLYYQVINPKKLDVPAGYKELKAP
jgi:hypothetical protein